MKNSFSTVTESYISQSEIFKRLTGHESLEVNTLEGYQIKGRAEYVTSGPIVDTFKALVEKMFNNTATAKGAMIITPEKVIVTTPGADNKKIL